MSAEAQTVTPLFHGAQNHCFGCGPNNPFGLKLQFSVTPELSVVCEANLSEFYEGPPGYVHGGVIATLLDEAMSKASRTRKVTAMTREMRIEYLKPVPSRTPIRILGQFIRSEGRKQWLTGEIQNLRGKVLARADGFFIAIHSDQIPEA